MRITDYSLSQQLLYNVNNVQQGLAEAYQQISTGQKLTNPSDDPSTVSHVFGQESALRSNAQYLKNLARANSVSTITYSAVSGLKDIVVSAEQLGIKSGSITSAADFTTNANQVNNLIEQAVDLLNTKNNGQYVFSANATGTAPLTVTRDANGKATAVAYAGSTSGSSFEVNDGVSLSPYSTPTQNQQLTSVINHLIALRDAMNNKDAAAVSTANTTLTSDEDVVLGQISAHAALQSRVELIQTQIKQSSTATDTEISALADADIAAATVRYNQMQNSYQAAISAGGKLMSTSLLNYINI
jgi:flagellar hook-associated protein 3 FlgL